MAKEILSTAEVSLLTLTTRGGRRLYPASHTRVSVKLEGALITHQFYCLPVTIQGNQV